MLTLSPTSTNVDALLCSTKLHYVYVYCRFNSPKITLPYGAEFLSVVLRENVHLWPIIIVTVQPAHTVISILSAGKKLTITDLRDIPEQLN